MSALTDLIEMLTAELSGRPELARIDGQLDRELFTTVYSMRGSGGELKGESSRRQLERLTETVYRMRTVAQVRERTVRLERLSENSAAAAQRPAAANGEPAQAHGGAQTPGAAAALYADRPDMESISRFFERGSRRYAGEFELYR